MTFTNELDELYPAQTSQKIIINHADMPNSKGVFFRAKQYELVEQYYSARLFLGETQTEDWEHWFETDKPDAREYIKNWHIIRMFEAALLFYNIVVDLSWVLCYVCAEYVLHLDGDVINLDKMMNLEDAYDALRKAEKEMHDPKNQFGYLKYMCPEFSGIIDQIINFWSDFCCTDIRNLNNFIKHRGKPQYEELECSQGPKLIGLYIKDVKYPTDIRDVQKRISLRQAIEDLVKLDNEKLFPYIKELFYQLEVIVKPSPLILHPL